METPLDVVCQQPSKKLLSLAAKQGNVTALFRVAELGRYNMNFTPTVENCPVLLVMLFYFLNTHENTVERHITYKKVG